MNFPSDHLLTSKSKWRINEKIQTAADRKWGMGQSKKQGETGVETSVET